MIAVLNTSTACPWAEAFGDVSWALLPVANRPLLDYWLEACSDQGIARVQIILGGEEAEHIEKYVRDGKRWNVEIEYTFARPGESPVAYLKSISKLWQEGLFYLGRPFFLRRRQAYRKDGLLSLEACRIGLDEGLHFLRAPTADEVRALLGGEAGSPRGLEQIHVHGYAIDGIKRYYELNMKMVAGEYSRYVTAGFAAKDGSSIGYNVRTPPSSQLMAPILVGDDCRFGAMTTVGANAVVGSHVIVDAYSELADCLVLDDTYIGRNLEIRQKIVAGNRVIDAHDGTMVEIDDSWLIARNKTDTRTEDVVRYIILWFVALGLAMLQLLPFLLLYPWLRLLGIASFTREEFHDPRTGHIKLPVFYKRKDVKSVAYRLFRGLSLDRFPWILLVLRSRMYLCGQPPMRHPDDSEIITQLKQYYPGVFCYQDYNKDSDRLIDSLWYAHIRSLYEDLKILIKALLTRFLTAGRQ